MWMQNSIIFTKEELYLVEHLAQPFLAYTVSLVAWRKNVLARLLIYIYVISYC